MVGAGPGAREVPGEGDHPRGPAHVAEEAGPFHLLGAPPARARRTGIGSSRRPSGGSPAGSSPPSNLRRSRTCGNTASPPPSPHPQPNPPFHAQDRRQQGSRNPETKPYRARRPAPGGRGDEPRRPGGSGRRRPGAPGQEAVHHPPERSRGAHAARRIHRVGAADPREARARPRSQERLLKATYDYNASKKGRLYPAKTVGDAVENVPGQASSGTWSSG